MGNKKKLFLIIGLFFVIWISGCGKKIENTGITEDDSEEIQAKGLFLDESSEGEPEEPQPNEEAEAKMEKTETVPVIKELELEKYFEGLNGCAVFYLPAKNEYRIYNQKLADVRRSPCSTFKIISSLIGLEKGVIKPDDSVRTWSKETFWNEDWNRDIDFEQAFRTSCIWYFREVINELGKEEIQDALNNLKYGNCDIRDWEGRLNTNNNNRALTGFWVESSLLISPREQTEVLAKIFSEDAEYKRENVDWLSKVMQVTEQTDCKNKIYGKTGLGKKDGKTIDSWFVGYIKAGGEQVYFSVYLGESGHLEASSKKAKEIALKLAADFYNY